jgi:hypothetical protein
MNNKSKVDRKPIDQIKCVWGLLCSLSSNDQERNNISLFNVIDQFNLPAGFFDQQEKEKKPLLVPLQHEMVIHWRRTLDIGIIDDEIFSDFKVKTIDPAGIILQEILNPLNFPKGIKILRSRLDIPGVLATTAGSYIHQIEIKLPNQSEFKKVLEIPFEIRKRA